jgi:hypothetical protein
LISIKLNGVFARRSIRKSRCSATASCGAGSACASTAPEHRSPNNRLFHFQSTCRGLPRSQENCSGDADFFGISAVGAASAAIAFGGPVPFSGTDLKMAAKSIEWTVRRLTSAALRGRAAPI